MQDAAAERARQTSTCPAVGCSKQSQRAEGRMPQWERRSAKCWCDIGVLWRGAAQRSKLAPRGGRDIMVMGAAMAVGHRPTTYHAPWILYSLGLIGYMMQISPLLCPLLRSPVSCWWGHMPARCTSIISFGRSCQGAPSGLYHPLWCKGVVHCFFFEIWLRFSTGTLIGTSSTAIHHCFCSSGSLMYF